MLAWPERVSILLGIALLGAVLMLGTFLNASSASSDWVTAGAQIWWQLAKIFIFPLWVVMRLIDIVGGGPGRRKAIIAARSRSLIAGTHP